MNRLFAKKKSKSPENNGISPVSEITNFHPESQSPLVRDKFSDGNDSTGSGSPRSSSNSISPKSTLSDSRNGTTGSSSPASKPSGQLPNNAAAKPKLVFHCQQAQGSPTGLISGFTSVRELYQKVSECYDMDPSQVRIHQVFYESTRIQV